MLIELDDVHLEQVLNYLKAYYLEGGLLINLGSKSLPLKDYFSKIKSVKSINTLKSVIQTIYHIVTKGHGGV